MDKRKTIRDAYRKFMPEIIKHYPRCNPYFIDWAGIFSPAEDMAWSDIRLRAFPLYPQFPVEGYFLDFADPIKKIAIEIDGLKFHKDKEKDKVRQKEIEKLGWKFYRFNWYDLLEHETQQYNEFGEEIGDTYLANSRFYTKLLEIYRLEQTFDGLKLGNCFN